MLAYNRFIGVARLACPATWAPQTLATVRWKLGQGAGRILRHAGHVVLRLVVDAEARDASDARRAGTVGRVRRGRVSLVYLVYSVCLVCLLEPDRPDKQERPVGPRASRATVFGQAPSETDR